MAKTKTVTDLFQEHLGAHEYDSFVSKMIKWYYGYDAKVAWCAISMSYMMNQLGLLDQIGGKNQNVYRMLVSTAVANKKTGKGKLLYRKDLKSGDVIKRGTVIFLMKDEGEMKATSSKHVTTAYDDFVYNGTGWFDSLGGNQDNYIKVKKYPQKHIYAIFAPQYNVHKTLRRDDTGAEVKELQKDLKALGFGRVTGKRLLAGGGYRANTEATVKEFQRLTGCCKPDGICGQKTWAMIDKMLAEPLHSTVALTNVYVRTRPDLDGKKIAKIKEGTSVQFTNIVNGWLYIPKKKGWSKSSYYKL